MTFTHRIWLLAIVALSLVQSGSAAARSSNASSDRVTFDWKPIIVAAGGASADAISTHRFIGNGSGCVEATARYTQPPYTPAQPNFRAMWTDNAISIGAVGLAMWLTHLDQVRHPESKSARWRARLLKAGAYAAGSWRASRAVRNVSLCGW